MVKILRTASIALLTLGTLCTPPALAQSSVPAGSSTPRLGSSNSENPGAELSSGLPGAYDANDPFYMPPADMPQEAGALIRQQPFPNLIEGLGPEFKDKAQKILYTSTTVHDEPVATSGYVLDPVGEWQGKGPTPTLVVAPPSRGAADVCAPSRSDHLAAAFDPANGQININYDLPLIFAASMEGYRVIVTDYIGLGTPGVHTYALVTEEGRAVLDAARAGLRAVGAPADSPVVFSGYSQGGGATAAAAEQQPTYAPELNLKATYAGAPPANLGAVAEAVDGNGIFGVLGWAIAGYSERYPEFKKAVDDILNEEGQRYVEDTNNSCLIDVALKWGFVDSSQLTKSGEKLSDIVLNRPDILGIFDKLGEKAPTSPIMISSPESDDTIPNWQVRELAQKYCEAGTTVVFQGSGLPSLTSSIPTGAGDHGIGTFLFAQPSLDFLTDTLNGVEPKSSCGGSFAITNTHGS